MSPEVSILARLKSTYSTRPHEITPVRALAGINKSQLLTEIGRELGILNMFLLEKVFFLDGKLLLHKKITFVKGLQVLERKFGEESVSYLEPECVRNDGSIDFRKFKKYFGANRDMY